MAYQLVDPVNCEMTAVNLQAGDIQSPQINVAHTLSTVDKRCVNNQFLIESQL